MRKVTLKKLTVENFKGRNMAFEFSHRTVLRGTNKTGKSTLANAFFWLLTGADAKDRVNRSLYDTTLEFTYENATTAVVEGVFDVDGIEYVFKRTAKSKWERKRGSAEYTKAKSDEYCFYVDGLAVTANDYASRIEAVFGPTDKLKLMLNARYYELLDWKKLRKHFADLVGVVYPDELQGDYSLSQQYVDKYGSAENALLWLRQRITPIEKDIAKYTSEVKGMRSMLPDVSQVDGAERELVKLNGQLKEIDEQIVGIGKSNEPIVALRKQIRDQIDRKQFFLSDARRRWDAKQQEPIETLRAALRDVEKHNAEVDADRAYIQRQIDATEIQIEFLEDDLNRLRAEKDEIKARVFNDDMRCPTCGRELEAEAIAKARQEFYDERDRQKNDVVKRGVRTKEQLARQQELMAELKEKQSALKYLSREELEAHLAEEEADVTPFEETSVYEKTIAEIAALQDKMPDIPTTNTDELTAQKEEIYAKIAEVNAIINKKSDRIKAEAKIWEYEDMIENLTAEKAEYERLEDNLKERVREWAGIVRDRANKYLNYAHVEMTEITKSGELVDVCTLTAQGVDADDTNTESQVNIGVDVANAFQKSANVMLPIFIDNADGIASYNMPDVENQLVALYMDENYHTLTKVG